MHTRIETPLRIEPCFPEEISPQMADLISELTAATGKLGNRLHKTTALSLAELLRVMNCYYSNLIEGHNTTPREIELALSDKFNPVEERRNLQLEARAHIRVQREIDQQYSQGILPEPASIPFLCWLHKAFYENAGEEMLHIRGKNREFRMEVGVFRSQEQQDVSVGRHQPPSSKEVHAFMSYFERRYQLLPLGKASRIISMAAAHHRFNYIHPFPDGNGRVSRLMSHAMALQAGIGAHGLWSISRGLARGLKNREEYKRMMDRGDTPRQGDLDGRGNLSLKAFNEFVMWFLRVCLDQVTFMDQLFDLDHLNHRLQIYTDAHHFKPAAFSILEAALMRGELARGEISRICGMKERTARGLLHSLVEDGILGSDTPKGPVSLRFLPHTADILFPSFF